MSKKIWVIGISGFLVLFAALGMWFKSEEPVNVNGYKYRTYFVHAGMSSRNGVLSFNAVRQDSIRLFMEGDTLVVDYPDRPDMRYPGAFIPSPVTVPVKVATGMMTLFNLQSVEFYSVYSFPDSTYEVWPGTTPGKGYAYIGSRRINVAGSTNYSTGVAYDSLGGIRHYKWIFGEPDSAVIVAPTHMYGYAGNVAVSLIDGEDKYVMLLINRGPALPDPPLPLGAIEVD